VLAEHGIEVSTARSKSWDDFAGPEAPIMDAVITVCGSAAAEICPIWPGVPLRAHWGAEDPAALPHEMQRTGFLHTYDLLDTRAEALLALPIETMRLNELKAALDRIGTLA
jgi:arsenate reductase (thioredoxin)